MEKKIQEARVQKILQIIRSGKAADWIRNALTDYHENDIADVLALLTPAERLHLSQILPVDRMAEILEYVEDTDDAEKYLGEMPDERAAAILSSMESDEAVDFLKNTDSEKKTSWLAKMNPEIRKSLTALASFDEDTIASRMTTNFVTVEECMTVPEAMKEVVKEAADNDNITVIYVVDRNDNYAGAFSLKDLIVARRDTPLDNIIVKGFPFVYANEKISDCVQIIEDYEEASIPVLSKDKKILGVVTASDIAEVIGDELGDDYAKLGGLSAEEDLDEPLSQSIKKRLPWLVLLLFLGVLVSTVVGMYEQVVAKLTLIMAFQSMILDMSGNVGTQSLAVTIRVLMDENLSGSEKWKLIRKEASAGFCNGLILGVIAVGAIGIYITAAKHYPASTAFSISLCIGLSLMLSMLISSLVGTVVPMFFKRIHVDPAVASGPLITTVTDLVGVVTYYSLAWFMLIRILGM
jgi:magnesium transporter